jgi:hypothetical protein
MKFLMSLCHQGFHAALPWPAVGADVRYLYHRRVMARHVIEFDAIDGAALDAGNLQL